MHQGHPRPDGNYSRERHHGISRTEHRVQHDQRLPHCERTNHDQGYRQEVLQVHAALTTTISTCNAGITNDQGNRRRSRTSEGTPIPRAVRRTLLGHHVGAHRVLHHHEHARAAQRTVEQSTSATRRARLHPTTHIARICATHTTYTAAMQRNATFIPVWPMSYYGYQVPQ